MTLAPRTWTFPWWLAAAAVLSLPVQADWLEWTLPLALVPFVLLVETQPRPRLLTLWAFGTTYVFLGLWWMNAVHPLATLATAAYFGLHAGWGAWLACALRHRAGLPLALAAPLGQLAGEVLREDVSFWSATWLHVGQGAWRVSPLAQAAELGGLAFVGFLVLGGVAALVQLALAWRRGALSGARAWAVPVGMLALLAAGVAAGAHRERHVRAGFSAAPPGLTVALIQGNLAQSLKNRDENADLIVGKHAQATLGLPKGLVDLVAWPETTATYAPEVEEERRLLLGSLARAAEAPLLLGAVGVNPDAEPPAPSNSAFLFSREGELVARWDKRVLVPGGERLPVVEWIPPLRAWLVDALHRSMRFRPYLLPGRTAVTHELGAHRIGVQICYDDSVPMPSDELWSAGVDALLVLSNEAWFGARELDQHLALATFRCIETRLPMARATNTGLTCTIDPTGRVGHVLPRNQDGVLVDRLQPTAARALPPLARDAFKWALTLAALALAARGAWRARVEGVSSPAAS